MLYKLLKGHSPFRQHKTKVNEDPQLGPKGPEMDHKAPESDPKVQKLCIEPMGTRGLGVIFYKLYKL